VKTAYGLLSVSGEVIAWLFYGQSLDLPAVIGMLLIVVGVIVLNVFSKTVSHS